MIFGVYWRRLKKRRYSKESCHICSYEVLVRLILSVAQMSSPCFGNLYVWSAVFISQHIWSVVSWSGEFGRDAVLLLNSLSISWWGLLSLPWLMVVRILHSAGAMSSSDVAFLRRLAEIKRSGQFKASHTNIVKSAVRTNEPNSAKFCQLNPAIICCICIISCV